MDLERYFDTVNQSKLIQILSETIKDGRVISLIHKFLRAGIMVDGLFEESPEGVPQRGPLSPLLGNIMLNECDHELERRGHRLVRYANDNDDLLQKQKSGRPHPEAYPALHRREAIPSGKQGKDKCCTREIRQVLRVRLLCLPRRGALKGAPQSKRQIAPTYPGRGHLW